MKLNNTKIISIKYGDQVLNVKLKQSNKRKTVAIKILPSKEITVNAPQIMSFSRIESLIIEKFSWIQNKLKQIDRTNSKQSKAEFKSGEIHYFLGEKYNLVIQQAENNQVILTEGKITIETTDPTNGLSSKHILDNWYWEQAKCVLKKRFEKLFTIFNIYNLKQPILTIERSKSRWGQCIGTHHIKLNKQLIRTPIKCIDYVIMHELCHLIEPNHSKKFYALLEKYIPNWKSQKKELTKYQAFTIN
jgi:predicted metal-dependent hydrolase